MMRDYKFRVGGHGFRRQPNRRSRRALRLGSLALMGGISYAVVQLAISPEPRTAASSGDSEVISLPLPSESQRDEPQDRQPALGLTIDATKAPAERDRGTDVSALPEAPNDIPASRQQRLTLEDAALEGTTAELPSLTFEKHPEELANLGPDLHQLIGISHEELLELSLASTPALALAFPPHVAGIEQQTEINQALSGLDALPPSAVKPVLQQGPFRLDYRVQPGDTLGTILESQGLPGRVVYQILDQVSDQHRRRLERIRPGEIIGLHFDQELRLHNIELKLSATDRLLVSRENDSVSASIKSTPTEPRRQCLTAVVDHSLYGAAKNAGIPDQVTQRAINIFRHQIDFARQTRKGDQISVLFEQVYAGEEPIAAGPVLAVEITTGRKQYAAVRYTTSKGATDYYSADGQPIDKGSHSFLRTPLRFTRVSSRFSNGRMHPILRRVRPHTGVDLAAPAGRRVMAAADGKIYFKGRKSGYGNIVILRHGARYETRYAHLMRFAKGLSNGGSVKRGDTIGYVGQTGLATGPHLHYEIRINGTPVDPLTAKLPFLNEFDDSEKARFRRQTRPLLAELQRTRESTLLVDARSFNNLNQNGDTLQ